MSHYPNLVALNLLIRLHQMLNSACKFLLLLGLFNFFVCLCFLKHFLNCLLELVSRQERDDVLGQRVPLVIFLDQKVQDQAVAAVGKHVQAAVGEVRTEV